MASFYQYLHIKHLIYKSMSKNIVIDVIYNIVGLDIKYF